MIVGGTAIVAVGTFFLYMWATDRDVDPTMIPGNYQGEYSGGRETFTLRPDGSFSQTFQAADRVVYSSTGSWAWRKDEGKVYFEPLFSPDHAGENDGKPIVYDRTGIPLDRREPTLILDEDLGIFAKRLGNSD
ncbi:MAG: hypothetical protein WC943_09350 [Elusimicrobiota bacterium]|jgi:hypothetical protein